MNLSARQLRESRHFRGTSLREYWLPAALVILGSASSNASAADAQDVKPLTVGVTARAWGGTPACDRALSYFRTSGGNVQWRVYDPTSRSDTLFLTVEEVPSEMFWDTSLTRVDFIVG